MEKTLTTAAATYIKNVQLYATYTLKAKMFYQYNVIVLIKQHFHL